MLRMIKKHILLYNHLRNYLSEFKDIDVIAQAMTFYADGFETSSIALSFSLYEIASNKHVQEKLQQEIETVLAKYGGEITYDAVQEMTYLECVLCGWYQITEATVLINKN